MNRKEKGGAVIFLKPGEGKCLIVIGFAEKMVALIFQVTATRVNDQAMHFQRVHKGEVF